MSGLGDELMLVLPWIGFVVCCVIFLAAAFCIVVSVTGFPEQPRFCTLMLLVCIVVLGLMVAFLRWLGPMTVAAA